MLGLDETIADLQEEIKRLKGETYCAYCGERFPLDAPDSVELVGRHIEACPRHPMRAVEAERDASLAEVERLRERLQFDPGGSDKIDELEQSNQFIRHRAEAAEAEVEQLKNKLNADSQNFTIECLRAEVEMLRATPTAAQERAAIMEWIEQRIPLRADVFDLSEGIRRGDHWLEGKKR